MKKWLLVVTAISFSWMATSQIAEAKRFGMGQSFGFSKKMAPKKMTPAKPTAPAKQAQPSSKPAVAGAAARASGASRFLGPLAGLAAGGLIAAMFFGDGFQGIQFFDILLLALIALVLFKLFARRSAPQYFGSASQHESGFEAYSDQSKPTPAEPAYREVMDADEVRIQQGSMIGADLPEVGNLMGTAPQWFDQDGFLEQAKQHFVAVQKAWDNVDLNEIKAYCTPELYQALETEMQLMQPGVNKTHVEDLETEVVDMAVEGDYFIVSIRFSGFIQEAEKDDAHAFHEIWHIRRLAEGSGDWQIAGIQQVH